MATTRGNRRSTGEGRCSLDLFEIVSKLDPPRISGRFTKQISAVLAAYASALTRTGAALNSINKSDLMERQYLSTQSEAKKIVEAVRAGVYGAGSGLTYDAAQLVFASVADELSRVLGSR